MKDFFNKLIRPSGFFLGLIYFLTTIFVGTSLMMLFVDYSDNLLLSIVAYSSFGLAGITFSYSVYTIVVYAPGMSGRVIALMQRNRIIEALLNNWGFRTIATSTISFGMSVFSSVTNAYLGIVTKSIWFGALSAYYLFLALMRSGLLLYQRNKKDFEGEAIIRAKKYTRCGVLLLILNVALSSAIAQMIFDDRSFEYKDWLIYAFAAYAFYKIIMSVRNAIKAQHQDDLTIRAIREINMVDAAVSILALQTALLHTFNDGSINISHFNTITGCFVSAFSLALSVYMIVRGTKIIKEIRKNNA